jgi:hypothetical protein
MLTAPALLAKLCWKALSRNYACQAEPSLDYEIVAVPPNGVAEYSRQMPSAMTATEFLSALGSHPRWWRLVTQAVWRVIDRERECPGHHLFVLIPE